MKIVRHPNIVRLYEVILQIYRFVMFLMFPIVAMLLSCRLF